VSELFGERDRGLLRPGVADRARSWKRENSQADTLFARWAAANTKQCPNCRAVIEKNGLARPRAHAPHATRPAAHTALNRAQRVRSHDLLSLPQGMVLVVHAALPLTPRASRERHYITMHGTTRESLMGSAGARRGLIHLVGGALLLLLPFCTLHGLRVALAFSSTSVLQNR
jgi:hypothetical protein